MVGKGSIVRYKNIYYRVTSATKNTVNLTNTVFGSKVLHKGIPKSEVVEAYDEWRSHWYQSETFQSM